MTKWENDLGDKNTLNMLCCFSVPVLTNWQVKILLESYFGVQVLKIEMVFFLGQRGQAVTDSASKINDSASEMMKTPIILSTLEW